MFVGPLLKLLQLQFPCINCLSKLFWDWCKSRCLSLTVCWNSSETVTNPDSYHVMLVVSLLQLLQLQFLLLTAWWNFSEIVATPISLDWLFWIASFYHDTSFLLSVHFSSCQTRPLGRVHLHHFQSANPILILVPTSTPNLFFIPPVIHSPSLHFHLSYPQSRHLTRHLFGIHNWFTMPCQLAVLTYNLFDILLHD